MEQQQYQSENICLACLRATYFTSFQLLFSITTFVLCDKIRVIFIVFFKIFFVIMRLEKSNVCFRNASTNNL